MSVINWVMGRSLENPTTSLADPANWLSDAVGGGASDSGITVNSSTALTYSAVWRGVNLVARDVAKLPCVIYRRVGGGKERATDHPTHNLLAYKPNTDMTAFSFKAAVMHWALLKGNGYAYIVRRGDGRPVELWPLSAERTYPVRENGMLWYVTTVENEQRKIPARDMFHVRGITTDGVTGISVVEKARDSFGLGMAAHKYGRIFFKNSAKPPMVLEHPNQLSDPAKKTLRDSWLAMHQGLDNAHKVAVLEEGMKVHEFGISNEDAQFLETRQFEIREVANWFGVPPHKLGDTTRTAYASLEQENQAYLDDALDPWLVAYETEAWDKLLTQEERDSGDYVVEFLRNALVRANLQARGAYYQTAIQGGWMSPDEVRAKENENEQPGGIGRVYYRPLNVALADENGLTYLKNTDTKPAPASETTQGEQGEPQNPAQSNTAALGALELAFTDAARRMHKRIMLHVERAQKRGELARWLGESMRNEHSETVREAFEPFCTLGCAGHSERLVTALLDSIAAQCGDAVAATSGLYASLLREGAKGD